MERREFLALSAAPIATSAGLSLLSSPKSREEGDTPIPLPPAAEMVDRASKLEIGIDRNGASRLEIVHSFGLLEEDDYSADDGCQRERAASFRLIRALLAEFERGRAEPDVHQPGKDATQRGISDADIVASATQLNITIYRGDTLEGHVGIVCGDLELPAELAFRSADALPFIRELLAAFARKPTLYQAAADNKLSAV